MTPTENLGLCKPGDRVGAIVGGGAGVLMLLGYGVYLGDEEIGTEAVGEASSRMRESGTPTPKIHLDDGTILWGTECYFASERVVKDSERMVKRVERVSIDDFRERFWKQAAISTDNDDRPIATD